MVTEKKNTKKKTTEELVEASEKENKNPKTSDRTVLLKELKDQILEG